MLLKDISVDLLVLGEDWCPLISTLLSELLLIQWLIKPEFFFFLAITQLHSLQMNVFLPFLLSEGLGELLSLLQWVLTISCEDYTKFHLRCMKVFRFSI